MERRALTDSSIEHLRGLPLRKLDLSGCTWLTQLGLSQLGQLPLTSLSLAHCEHQTIVGIPWIASMPLASLDLSFTPLDDAGLACLQAMTLESLKLCGCLEITGAAGPSVSLFDGC